MHLILEGAFSKLRQSPMYHVTGSEQDVLGVILIKGRQIDPVRSQTTKSIGTSLGTDSTDGRRAASEAFGEK